jgi:hypothetical protein
VKQAPALVAEAVAEEMPPPEQLALF